MPGNVAPVANEREGLLAYLAQQRYVLRLAAYGLTDEQARLAPSASTLSVGGLIKHVTAVEADWVRLAVGRPSFEMSPEEYHHQFVLGEDETLEEVLRRYDEVAADTERAIAEVDDLGQEVPVPDLPWFPDDVEAWSVRWVLLHLIQETARHAGHADIVRETIDGATGFPLMAAAENWPPSPWIQPWRPSSDAVHSAG